MREHQLHVERERDIGVLRDERRSHSRSYLPDLFAAEVRRGTAMRHGDGAFRARPGLRAVGGLTQLRHQHGARRFSDHGSEVASVVVGNRSRDLLDLLSGDESHPVSDLLYARYLKSLT